MLGILLDRKFCKFFPHDILEKPGNSATP